MDEHDLKRLFAEVFELDVSTVEGSMSPDTVDAWDSFGHMRLITAVEKASGVRLSMEEVLAIDSFDALCRTVATVHAE